MRTLKAHCFNDVGSLLRPGELSNTLTCRVALWKNHGIREQILEPALGHSSPYRSIKSPRS
jgi:hypothetical protein